MTAYQGHQATVEKVGKGWRWKCTTLGCRDFGGWVKTKRRALDGAFYHEYANRPTTADEILTGGDGMYADLTRTEALERAAESNRRQAAKLTNGGS